MAKGKNATRHGERELAFQVLYGLSFTPARSMNELRRVFRLSPDNAARQSAQAAHDPEQEPRVAPSGFAWELVEGVWSKSAELDAAISRFSHNWRVDRMGRVELTLLRLAVFEMLYRQDVPPKVAINEALELSRLFGEGNAKSFINGILDAVAKALENGELERPAGTPFFSQPA